MSPDLEKKVIADLEKTGFPSEFEARRIIYSFSGGWDCTGTMGYFDRDEQKLRQVDKYLGFAEKQHDAIRKAILEFGGLGGYSEEEIYNGAKPKKAVKIPSKLKRASARKS